MVAADVIVVLAVMTAFVAGVVGKERVVLPVVKVIIAAALVCDPVVVKDVVVQEGLVVLLDALPATAVAVVVVVVHIPVSSTVMHQSTGLPTLKRLLSEDGTDLDQIRGSPVLSVSPCV